MITNIIIVPIIMTRKAMNAFVALTTVKIVTIRQFAVLVKLVIGVAFVSISAPVVEVTALKTKDAMVNASWDIIQIP